MIFQKHIIWKKRKKIWLMTYQVIIFINRNAFYSIQLFNIRRKNGFYFLFTFEKASTLHCFQILPEILLYIVYGVAANSGIPVLKWLMTKKILQNPKNQSKILKL